MRETRIYTESLDGYVASIEISDTGNHILLNVDAKRVLSLSVEKMRLLVALIEKAIVNKENFKMEDLL